MMAIGVEIFQSAMLKVVHNKLYMLWWYNASAASYYFCTINLVIVHVYVVSLRTLSLLFFL